jgi:LysM repeat protein
MRSDALHERVTMALPSQTTRVSLSGRTYGTRKRRRVPMPAVLAGVAGLAVVGVLWATLGGGPRKSDVAGVVPPAESGRLLASPEASAPANSPAPKPSPSEPEPAVLEIGQGRLSSATPSGPPPLTSTTTDGPGKTPAIKEAVREPVKDAPEVKVAEGDPVSARARLSRALADATGESERVRLRQELTRLNEDLVFSPRVAAGDPFVMTYAVQSNDALERIAKKTGAAGHWRLIQRVNRLANPNRIQLNQQLKVVKGPFHAVVVKSAFRLDLYMGDAAKPAEWVYVRSFPVGLGEGGGTPVGHFVVKPNSKLENPYWVNPRTGEQFHKDDPKNPIGERWIGLQGVGDSAAATGYGIHGTIDPDSVGKEKSMGCVRMNGEDVELVYDVLTEGVSVVEIKP